MSIRRVALSSSAVAVIAVIALVAFMPGEPEDAAASGPPEVIRLRGTVRDFTADHPDFDVRAPGARGNCARHVEAELPLDGRPLLAGAGMSVIDQWRDKDDNPIAPYFGDDPGLPGGHFDVDVFDEATDKERYHQHEFDDKFDVTYVDVAGDPKLLFDEIIGPGYPNDLRVVFYNPEYGSGTYTVKAGASEWSGNTKDGFEATFDPATLVRFRVDFALLDDLRKTVPGDVQKDVAERNGSFAVRMYDVPTGVLVYELAVYHHYKGDGDGGGGGGGGSDSCGDSINDTFGSFGGTCDGGVTGADSFAQWFRDVLGTNLSKAHTISLYRSPEGVYEYLTDEFYPIDGELLDDGAQEHNNFFTYSISATFTYDACVGQFFEFEGNDDAWVFIDGELAIDLGGIATTDRQYVALDRLDLTDGREYKLDFFYAHRRRDPIESLFRMRTNIELSTGAVPVSLGYD